MNKPKTLDKIKSSIFKRTLSMTKLTVSTGGKTAAHLLTQIFSDEKSKEQKWTQFLTEQAMNMSLELGELKGSLMKAGQMISMYGELFLPPQANEFLKTLQSNSPPLKFSEIEKILIENLGDKLKELEIDPQPIGAASLGQVHQAKILATGEVIALKIQYPGVEQAIESDLKALRTLFSVLSLLPSDFQTDIMFNEIRDMLKQEVNYRLEVEHTIEYRKKFENDPKYIVPKIYLEYCGDKVIASSFEQGISVDDALVKNLSQDRRNQIGMNFLELYFKEIFEFGFIQTDPHLGNYKIRLKSETSQIDQIILLDFGAARAYDKKFLNVYAKMIRAALMRDLSGLDKASLDLKFTEQTDSNELKKIFQEFCLMTVEPFLSPDDPRCNKNFMSSDGVYYWQKSDLPKRLTSKAVQIIKDFPLRAPPKEVIFLDRKTGGVFIFLNVLNAQIKARDLILKYLSLNIQNNI